MNLSDETDRVQRLWSLLTSSDLRWERVALAEIEVVIAEACALLSQLNAEAHRSLEGIIGQSQPLLSHMREVQTEPIIVECPMTG